MPKELPDGWRLIRTRSRAHWMLPPGPSSTMTTGPIHTRAQAVFLSVVVVFGLSLVVWELLS